MMFPFPFMIKAKYFVGILIVITLAFAMSGSGGVAYVAHLGGLLFGWLYVRRGLKPVMRMGLANVTTACAIPITAGSASARPRNSKFTCRSTTASPLRRTWKLHS